MTLSRLKAMLPPGLKSAIHRLRGIPLPASTGYKPIQDVREIESLKNAWQDPSIPQAQRRIVEKQLSEMYAGQPSLLFSVLAEAVSATGKDLGEIVEVGCSSGHHREVLECLLAHPVDYIGIDYSLPFVEMAQRFYPEVQFAVANATDLPLAEHSCDILISGCVLLHVPDYCKAIAESVRVSRDWVIFHRTPIIMGNLTRVYEKKAYGVRCIEMSFSEAEILEEFAKGGLLVVEEYEIEKNVTVNSEQQSVKTYLCRKIAKNSLCTHF